MIVNPGRDFERVDRFERGGFRKGRPRMADVADARSEGEDCNRDQYGAQGAPAPEEAPGFDGGQDDREIQFRGEAGGGAGYRPAEVVPAENVHADRHKRARNEYRPEAVRAVFTYAE